MHSLIILSHPNRSSLTHAVGKEVGDAIAAAAAGNEVEIADLTAEGFDPRFSMSDIETFGQVASPPASILAEQARIDRADRLVLVYPVYWWSMPALLKGWIDRVFANGWAYEESLGGKVEKKLDRLGVHLIAIGATNAGTYAKHGYSDAMKTQIEHGIFDYCGARVLSSDLLAVLDPAQAPEALAAARQIGNRIGSPALRDAA
ncbi:MAG: NAD(P)H-dependent oxidoreductase [Sphingopyxis sp.]|uniref:NAD(P)H-dependent oxidoreductase n=1 Tax=Sphingopyxis sp. TaxID=1908224 RepID=UPI002ABBA550|nr:NAD(P)H-dependent oxidoreductase [Sphingopyxis sp.]MDZ3832915.1 NAD(P)H-dependent oxidoreductase [Sphingopyxis sp.]